VGIPADVITLATPHDVISAGSTDAVESAQYLDHVIGRRAAEHDLRDPTATVEALTHRQHCSRCIVTVAPYQKISDGITSSLKYIWCDILLLLGLCSR